MLASQEGCELGRAELDTSAVTLCHLLQVSTHAAVLVDHWQQLHEAVAATSSEEEADEQLPLGGELRRGWWQAQPEQQEQGAAGAEQVPPPGPAGEDAGGHQQQAGGSDTSNLRDSVFRLALPEDWQMEAAEPPGLACTLFRYQRRCLAWLRWRESLGGGAGSGSEDGAAGEGIKPDPEAAGGSADSPAAGAAPADPCSRKSALPTTSLLWQPLTLPSGLRVWHNPLDGGVQLQPVGPPLPEVSGGLLCEEMGLGEWLLGAVVREERRRALLVGTAASLLASASCSLRHATNPTPPSLAAAGCPCCRQDG